jgi:hypothetical protein
MEKKEFERQALAKLNEWFENGPKEILHFWFDEGIMYAVVTTREHFRDHIYFFRVFTIGKRIEISQDKKVEL